jgi:hypothetical protein
MKVARSQWILVATACVIVASPAAQSGADRPPGADGNNWVPISETAGIILTNVGGMRDAIRLQLRGLDVEPIVPRQATGILMVKHGGTWMRVDLEPPPARVQPLH